MVYKNLNILSKQNFSITYLTLRSSIKASHANVSKLVPAGLRLRQYFTSNEKQLQSPENTKKASGKTKLPYDADINVPNNMLLYSDGNRKIFYGTLSIYGCAICAVLIFIGDSIRMAIRDVPVPQLPADEKVQWWKWWRKIRLSTNTVKNILYTLCVVSGLLVLAFAQLYPLRVVSSIYLLQGGRMVSWATYRPFGRIRQAKFPLKDISCENDPATAGRFIPFKVKGKRLFYLVDTKHGKFYNENLYKASVGLRRVFPK